MYHDLWTLLQEMITNKIVNIVMGPILNGYGVMDIEGSDCGLTLRRRNFLLNFSTPCI